MDWEKLIRELMAAGVKQAEIAERCGVSQGSVSDLCRIEGRVPNFDFGTKLIALHKERCPEVLREQSTPTEEAKAA